MSSRDDPLRSGTRPIYGSALQRRADGGPIARRLPGLLLATLVALLLVMPFFGREERTVLAAAAPAPGPPAPGHGSSELPLSEARGVSHVAAALAANAVHEPAIGELAQTSSPNPGIESGERVPVITESARSPLELVVQHHANGALRARGYSRDGRRQGLWLEWWENGAQRSEGSYQNDLRDGPWVHWYSSGRLREEGVYAAGERDGHWETWHESGEHKRRAEYRTGIRDGLWQEWYSDGQIMQSGVFQDGLREGYWEYFHFGARVDRRTGTYCAGRRLR